MPRKLAPEEKALWGKVIATVEPLGRANTVEDKTCSSKPVRVERSRDTQKARAPERPLDFARGERKKIVEPNNLDSHWDRRIKRTGLVPDISIDLHDSTLSRAYARLDGALEQAVAQKMKVILLVTGKPRAHDRASGTGRGAIAAVVRDWLAASRHARHISAVRNAHPRHGGEGALYIILKT
jgi:DNA-nicking Smr family endonuclease